MVRNERYVGDVLTPKKYTINYLTHEVKANKGQLPQYYIKNHHTPIIDRTLYEEVHAVLRQKSLKKIKHNKNETNPFSKRLICSECGRFYCMATRNDHLVWYCPSTRKTNGLQICHARFGGKAGTVVKIIFVPFIYRRRSCAYKAHVTSLCQLRNNFFSKISHKA